MAAKELITVIILHGHDNDEWLKEAVDSVKSQSYGIENIELMVIDNLDRKDKIGVAWNKAVSKAKGKYCFFLGDDDFIKPEYLSCLYTEITNLNKENHNIKCITSCVTRFQGTGDNLKIKTDNSYPTGMIETEYLKAHPFDETRINRIDTLWYSQNGNVAAKAYWNYGYFYRGHGDEISKCGVCNEVFDYVFITKYPHFIKSYIGSKKKALLIDKFDHLAVLNAKVVFCDFGSKAAVHVAAAKSKGKKILRIHNFSTYTSLMKEIDFSKFDHVIFTSNHARRYVETKISKTIKNASVINVGVNTDRFNFSKKVKNNKVGICGYINYKKGFSMLKLIANTFPKMQFHILGAFQDESIKRFLTENAPPNIFIKSWTDNPEKWYQDKTFILSTSLVETQQMSILEGMACGCKPAVISSWIGANDIYDPKHLWSNFNDLNNIFIGDIEPDKYRDYVIKNYNQKDEYHELDKIIGG